MIEKKMALNDLRFSNVIGDLKVNEEQFLSDKQAVVPAGQRYVILFTARSGSTWLTSALADTKVLGRPEEYLNPNFVRNVCQSMNARTETDLLEMLVRKRKTANGIFGIEVRHVDIELFGEGLFFEFFDSNTIFFNLWRDNIVAQGVSLYRAVYTGRFHSTEKTIDETPPFDIAETKRWITHLLSTENRNLNILAKRRRPARFLRYEDLLRDKNTSVAIFADALRVEPPNADMPAEAHPEIGQIRKIGDKWNRDAEEHFRRNEPEFIQEVESKRLIRKQPGDKDWISFDAEAQSRPTA